MRDSLYTKKEEALREKFAWQRRSDLPALYVENCLKEFLTFLRTKVPVPTTKISLTLHQRDMVPKSCTGTVVQYQGLPLTTGVALVNLSRRDNTADIHLAVKDKLFSSILGSLAHEYWHIVQTFVQYRDIENEGFAQAEGEANTMASKFSQEFRYNYITTDPRG